MEMSTLSVRQVQQMFAELLSFNGVDITWDLLNRNQSKILKDKINGLLNTHDYDSQNLRNLFKLIWEQRKFTNGQSLTSLFFVMIVDQVTNYKLAEKSRTWSLYPVFRCRRCVDDNSGRNHSSMECCMVYVTENGAFQNWETFLTGAKFPGHIVTPNHGVYRMSNGKVQLKTYPLERILRPSSMLVRFTKPGALQTTCVVHRLNVFQDMLRLYPNLCICEVIYFQLLNEFINPKIKDLCLADLSTSLVLFTHSVNNFRLATKMALENSCHNVLRSELRSQFEKIAGNTSSIKEIVYPIRIANEVPKKAKLDDTFKSVMRNRQEPIDLSVTNKNINLKDYGPTLEAHILNTESFEDLIASMSDNLEPEMFQLILKLTQNFMEKTREELMQLLKYHIPTETVLYQIILCILRRHSNLDFKEVEEQASDILRRVRYYFVSASPNSRPEFLKKCPLCVGYYDTFMG